MTDNRTGQFPGGQMPSGTAAPASPPFRQGENTDINTAGATAADLKQKVSDDIHSATDYAKKEISEASDKVMDAADERKTMIADKVSDIARVLEKVATEFEQGDNPEIGRLTGSLGANVRKFSEDIQGRSLGEIANMAEDFGRKQPLAFLGIAAVAGLAASRFLTASAPQQKTGSTASASAARASSSPAAELYPSSASATSNKTEGPIRG